MADYEGILLSIPTSASEQLCRLGAEGVRGMLPVGSKPLLYYSISALLSVGLERIHIVCSAVERREYEAYVKREDWSQVRSKASAFYLPHHRSQVEPHFHFTTFDELEQPSTLQLLDKVRPHLQASILFIVELGLFLVDGLAALADTFHRCEAGVALLFTSMPAEYVKKKHEPRTRPTYTLYVCSSEDQDLDVDSINRASYHRLRYISPSPLAQMRKLGMAVAQESDVKKRQGHKQQKSADFLPFKEELENHCLEMYNFMVDCGACVMQSFLLDYLLANQKDYEAKESFILPLINKFQYQFSSNFIPNTSSLLASVGEQEEFDIFPQPQPFNARVHVHICDSAKTFCLPLNCLEYYLLANQKATEKPRLFLVDQEPLVDPRADVQHRLPDNVVVGDGCRVEKESVVKASVLAPGVVVEKKAFVVSSVILKNAKIEEGANIVNSVVGASVEVESGSKLESCFVHREFKITANKPQKDNKIGLQ